MAERWEDMTPTERARLIRGHMGGSRPLTREYLCELFHLTPEGMLAIERGADWKPEYTTRP